MVALGSRGIELASFSLFSLGNWFGKLTLLKDNLIKQLKSGKNQLNIRGIKNFLFVCIFTLSFYFIYNLIISSFKKINNISFEIPPSDSCELSSKELLESKAISYYIEKIKKRDIFRMGPKSLLDDVAVISSKAAQATQNLRLVGISWSDEPDVMIEDIKAQKTFFVKKGQMVGDVKVESIFKDKIVLRYGKETIELR